MNLVEATRKAQDIMAEQGLSYPQWTLEWSNARAYGGITKFYPHGRNKIVLSRLIMRALPDDEATDVIIHEVAHALAGRNAAHGPVWRMVVHQLGGSAKLSCGSAEITRAVAKWRGECAVTGRVLTHKNRLTQKAKVGLVCRCHRERVAWIEQ